MIHRSIRHASVVALILFSPSLAFAQDYTTRVIARNLGRPTGLALHGGDKLYFTEIPTPGVGGGSNGVKELSIHHGTVRTIHTGEPEPVNLAVGANGDLYWTCRSAGVILEQPRRPASSTASVLLAGLARPTGIAVDGDGNVYVTQVPMPGVGGAGNSVSAISPLDPQNPTVLSMGEPEPADVAASREGTLYWTCRTAGVILTRSPQGAIALLLSDLDQPNGIALDEQRGILYWTELPTPGVSGAQGGSNRVMGYDLNAKQTFVVDFGDPEPTDVAVAPNGRVYWTCSSAGVIVEARRR